MRVTTINDDIALLDATFVYKQLDELVNGFAGLHQQHHAAGCLELGDKVLDVLCADDGFAFCFVLDEVLDFADGAVEGYDGEAVVGHVEDEVLAHDGQADEAEISSVVALLVAYSIRDVK